MIKTIITHEPDLGKKSESVTDFEAVKSVVDNLMDTAEANADDCAGLAANQIGKLLRVCVILENGEYHAIVNPKIIARSKEVKSDLEGCLSRPGKDGIRIRRHRTVTVRQYNMKTKAYFKKKYKGFTARIVQHALDHMNGKLI